jgi:flagellar biosynthesis chaperone FliJ
MKRYQFNLETVLRARRAQESVARADLQRSNLLAAAAEAASKKSREHYEEVVGSVGTPFMQHQERSELAAKALLGSEVSTTDAKAVVEKALHDYVAAAQAVSVLEHLDERRREEHAVAVAHEDATRLDELAMARHNRARAQAERAATEKRAEEKRGWQ